MNDMVKSAAETLESHSQTSMNEEVKAQSSISPEYKSSWNEVNIKGDYDQYARSVNSSRLTVHDTTPPKQTQIVSPRSNGNQESLDRSPSKRGRVKLNKTNGQVVKQAPVFVSEKQALKQSSTSNTPESKTSENEKELAFGEQQKKLNIQLNLSENQTKDEADLNNEERDRLIDDKSNVLKSLKHIPSNDERKSPIKQSSEAHQGRNFVKSSAEFSPPIVTAVDFREPTMSQAVKYATKNGLLIESPDFRDERPLDGNITRMSTLLMASYLGMGYNTNPSSTIPSFSVKQILPPLHPKSKIRRKRVLKRKNEENNPEFQITPQKPEPNVSKGDKSRDLAPLRDAYFYKWKHDPISHPEGSRHRHEKETPYRLPRRNDEIENIFDQIVRWRSKVRHCGKPAMYRRITSPTLGEVALSKKMTDRLPTRQNHKARHSSHEFQAQIEAEDLKPPVKSTSTTSVKQYIKERLRDAQENGAMTSPSVIEGFYDVTMKMKQSSLRRRLESNLQTNEILKLPLPDIALRKRQPVWQRMR